MSKKKNTDTIIIVECYSSAVNYIHDIRERGYEPILLELYVPEERRERERTINDRAYTFNNDSYPRVIMAQESYEETLDMIRNLSPVLILPGSDPGMEMALRLSADLGLKSNPLSILWNLRDKYVMQHSLITAGLRTIRSCIVSDEEDAVAFYRRENGRKVVIKPTQSAGSVNVFICGSETEVRRAYHVNSEFVKDRCRTNETVIIQEYIDGEEYVIDTISCEGRHAALFGMRYIKRMCKGYGKIYDTDIYFSPDEAMATELVDYCFKTLDCLGILYGPVHSEFIIDKNGPVLVEVNARPAGAFQKYTFQDKVMENHETAVSLDSYFMDKKQFSDRYPERMHLKQPAAVKQICLEEAIFVNKVRITERLSGLPGFEYAVDNGEDRIYPKTTDLKTNGGIIYVTSPDPDIIERDLSEIRRLEKHGLGELYDMHRICYTFQPTVIKKGNG